MMRPLATDSRLDFEIPARKSSRYLQCTGPRAGRVYIGPGLHFSAGRIVGGLISCRH